MTGIATEAQLAAGHAVGLELLAKVEAFARELLPANAGEEALSQSVGELLVMTVFQVGNDVEWLNRVHMTVGIGRAFGVMFAQHPDMRRPMTERLIIGIEAGRSGAAELFAPRGSA